VKSNDPFAKAMTGQSWDEFCDRLKELGQIIRRPEAPTSELDRAEGLRYLGRLTRLGLELCFEHADADFPVFLNAWNATTKAGADNPDNHYLNATVRGDCEYRVWGVRGTARSLRFATLANRDATEGRMALTGSLRAGDMTFAADGSFEIAVSRHPRPGNWLALGSDSSVLTVRQNLGDRRRELPAAVHIERIGGPSTPRLLTPRRADWALRGAVSFLERVAGRYADWAAWFQQRPNRLHDLKDTPFHEEGGDPRTCYMHGYWSVGADEALVIETEVPDCEMWNFQLNNYWMESLDYRHHPVCINKQQARYNSDGSLTLVVAASDPGVGNFLDTTGHCCGTMTFRWTGARSQPVPECRVERLITFIDRREGADYHHSHPRASERSGGRGGQ
jgi:hypothetical protein